MKQSLKERFARLGPVRGIGRVQSGLPADVVIRPDGPLGRVKTIVSDLRQFTHPELLALDHVEVAEIVSAFSQALSAFCCKSGWR